MSEINNPQGGSGDASWGSITGTLSDQSDLNTVLGGKQDSLGFTPVPNIRTVNTKSLSGNITLTQDDIGDGTTYKQYSATEKTKLSGIAEGAEVNVNADWNAISGDAQILNKPTIPTNLSDLTADSTHRLVTDTEKSTWNAKQDSLVSATNIKTINGSSMLGSGDLVVSGTLPDGDKGEITVTGGVWTIDNGVVTEAKQVLADNTTNNVSTSAHGYVPKLPNTTTTFFRGDGSFAEPKFQYTLQAYALNQATTTDGQTMYWGGMNLAPTTTADNTRIYIPKAGTITACYIFVHSGTAGSNENWSMYIRKNNTTDTLVQTLGANTAARLFSKTNLSISVSAGDYIEMKEIQPTWATNPANVRRSAVIYID